MKSTAQLIRDIAYWEEQEALGRPMPRATYKSLREELHSRLPPRLLDSLKPAPKMGHATGRARRGPRADA